MMMISAPDVQNIIAHDFSNLQKLMQNILYTLGNWTIYNSVTLMVAIQNAMDAVLKGIAESTTPPSNCVELNSIGSVLKESQNEFLKSGEKPGQILNQEIVDNEPATPVGPTVNFRYTKVEMLSLQNYQSSQCPDIPKYLRKSEPNESSNSFLSTYKVSLCKYYQQSRNCKVPHCQYAHGEKELLKIDIVRTLLENGGKMMLNKLGAILRNQPIIEHYLNQLKMRSITLSKFIQTKPRLFRIISMHPSGISCIGYAGVQLIPDAEQIQRLCILSEQKKQDDSGTERNNTYLYTE